MNQLSLSQKIGTMQPERGQVKLPLAEAINRVVEYSSIIVQYTVDSYGILLGIKNNCLYVYDKGVQIIPLRNKALYDFNSFVWKDLLLQLGDYLLVENGLDFLEIRITGFRLGLIPCGIVGETTIGNKKDLYDIARRNIVLHESNDEEASDNWEMENNPGLLTK